MGRRDNDADVDMAGGDLDIMDVSEDEPVRCSLPTL